MASFCSASLRTQAVDQPLVGILIGQLTKIEGASPGDIDAGAERVGIVTKAPDHLLRRFERAIGVDLTAVAELVDGAFLAHCRDHVLQETGLGRMVEDVTGRDRANAGAASLASQRIDTHCVVRAPSLEQRHVSAPAIDRLQVGKCREVRLIRLVRQQYSDDPLRPWLEVVPVEQAAPLPRPLFADGQEPRDPRPGGAIGRIEDQAAPAG